MHWRDDEEGEICDEKREITVDEMRGRNGSDKEIEICTGETMKREKYAMKREK